MLLDFLSHVPASLSLYNVANLALATPKGVVWPICTSQQMKVLRFERISHLGLDADRNGK